METSKALAKGSFLLSPASHPPENDLNSFIVGVSPVVRPHQGGFITPPAPSLADIAAEFAVPQADLFEAAPGVDHFPSLALGVGAPFVFSAPCLTPPPLPTAVGSLAAPRCSVAVQTVSFSDAAVQTDPSPPPPSRKRSYSQSVRPLPPLSSSKPAPAKEKKQKKVSSAANPRASYQSPMPSPPPPGPVTGPKPGRETAEHQRKKLRSAAVALKGSVENESMSSAVNALPPRKVDKLLPPPPAVAAAVPAASADAVPVKRPVGRPRKHFPGAAPVVSASAAAEQQAKLSVPLEAAAETPALAGSRGAKATARARVLSPLAPSTKLHAAPAARDPLQRSLAAAASPKAGTAAAVKQLSKVVLPQPPKMVFSLGAAGKMKPVASLAAQQRPPQSAKTTTATNGNTAAASAAVPGASSSVYDTVMCKLCGQGEPESRILLCDGCDRGYHMDCLAMPLAEVPEGEWFGPCCCVAATNTNSADGRQQLQQSKGPVAVRMEGERRAAAGGSQGGGGSMAGEMPVKRPVGRPRKVPAPVKIVDAAAGAGAVVTAAEAGVAADSDDELANLPLSGLIQAVRNLKKRPVPAPTVAAASLEQPQLPRASAQAAEFAPVVFPAGRVTRARRAELQVLLHLGMAQAEAPESALRQAFGDSPDVSRALRALVEAGTVLRCGGAGAWGQPYMYRLVPEVLDSVSTWAGELAADAAARAAGVGTAVDGVERDLGGV